MALCGEIVNFGGLGVLGDADEIGRISHIAVVQHEPRIFFVRVLIEMIDAIGVERRGAALDAVDAIALAEQEFGEISAILASGAGYKSYFVRHDLFLFKYLAMFDYSGRFY